MLVTTWNWVKSFFSRPQKIEIIPTILGTPWYYNVVVAKSYTPSFLKSLFGSTDSIVDLDNGFIINPGNSCIPTEKLIIFNPEKHHCDWIDILCSLDIIESRNQARSLIKSSGNKFKELPTGFSEIQVGKGLTKRVIHLWVEIEL